MKEDFGTMSAGVRSAAATGDQRAEPAVSICARAAELIDRLEHHKAALAGQSDLKIGPRTTIVDYEDSLAVLNDAYVFIRDHLRRTSR